DRPSLQDQKFHLLDRQLKQGLDLEASGLADKARADLLSRLRESAARLGETGAEAVEVDLDVDIGKDTELTRVVAALDRRKSDGDVRFMTVEVDGQGKPWQGKGFIPVAMGSLRNGWEDFVPAFGYTAEDVRTVTGMLEEVRRDREGGILHDVADALATISEPEGGTMNLSAAPPKMPRF
ncbi:MAG: hypothetical protein ACREJM_06970, partial [Candidatus Saccharimonadales bacterium]